MARFESDEARLEHAKGLDRKRKAEQAEALRRKNAPYGGPAGVARSCYTCKYRAGKTCDNAVAKMEGPSLVGDRIRSEDGLCGPNGIYWKPLSWRDRHDGFITFLSIVGILALIVAVLGAIGYFVHPVVAAGIALLGGGIADSLG